MSVSSESILFYNMLKFSWYHIEVKQKKDVFGKRTIANGCNFDLQICINDLDLLQTSTPDVDLAHDQVWLTKIWGQGKTYQQIDKSGILISKSPISWNKFYSIVSECKEFLSFKLKQLLTISVNPKLVNICFIKIILSKIILYTCNRLYKLVMWTFFPHIFNHYLLKLRI